MYSRLYRLGRQNANWSIGSNAFKLVQIGPETVKAEIECLFACWAFLFLNKYQVGTSILDEEVVRKLPNARPESGLNEVECQPTKR